MNAIAYRYIYGPHKYLHEEEGEEEEAALEILGIVIHDHI